jgi:hypothetical protein
MELGEATQNTAVTHRAARHRVLVDCVEGFRGDLGVGRQHRPRQGRAVLRRRAQTLHHYKNCGGD